MFFTIIGSIINVSSLFKIITEIEIYDKNTFIILVYGLWLHGPVNWFFSSLNTTVPQGYVSVYCALTLHMYVKICDDLSYKTGYVMQWHFDLYNLLPTCESVIILFSHMYTFECLYSSIFYVYDGVVISVVIEP